MKRQQIFTIILSSVFGGVIALSLFVFFMPKNTTVPKQAENSTSFTNYIFDSTDFVVPEGLNFVFAAKKAGPSVVHIRIKSRIAESGKRYPFGDLFKDHFKQYYNDTEDRYLRGAGSGVILSEEGYIVTNNHVVKDADDIEVILNDNRSFDAKIVGKDPSTDLAVIKIDADNITPLTFGNSDDMQVGEWVLAIGNPFEFRSTVTAGIVSAKGRNINILSTRDRVESFIQTDAAVNVGNSGGALVNLRGELIGINTAIATKSGVFSGYSFAVPASLAKKVVNDIIEYGAVQRALLGISIGDMNAELAQEKDLEVLLGVYVHGVGEKSAAEEAGIKEGDVIVAIDGNKVNNVAELQEQVAVNRPGEEIMVTYIRDNKKHNVKAKLKNSMGTTAIVKAKDIFEIEGVKFMEVPSTIAKKINIEGGVQVEQLRDGKWKNAGVREGFIITKIDRKKVLNMNDLISVLKSSKQDACLIEGYYPDGEKVFYGIAL